MASPRRGHQSQDVRKRSGGNSIHFSDSIRDPKRPIQHTVLFEYHPQDQCPFSKTKLSGPHKGKTRVKHVEGTTWRADFVSSETVLAAIDDGVEILSVRTERAALSSENYFKICPVVMNEVKKSASWKRDGKDYKCVGVYTDEDSKVIKEAEFIIFPSGDKKHYVAEVRVCTREDGLNPNMFDDSVDIRENFLQWIRYANKGKDGITVDRHIANGFTGNSALKFVST